MNCLCHSHSSIIKQFKAGAGARCIEIIHMTSNIQFNSGAIYSSNQMSNSRKQTRALDT